jgi:hypothetical protein
MFALNPLDEVWVKSSIDDVSFGIIGGELGSEDKDPYTLVCRDTFDDYYTYGCWDTMDEVNAWLENPTTIY